MISRVEAILGRALICPLFILLVQLTACSMVPELVNLGGTSSSEAGTTTMTTPSPTSQAVPSTPTKASVPTEETPPTDTPPLLDPSPTTLPTPTETPTPMPLDLSLGTADVYLYPVPVLYSGDKVTFQLLPYVPENVDASEVTVNIIVDGTEIADGTLGGRSHLSGEAIGLFEWVWDTSGTEGTHQVQVVLDKEDKILEGDENPDNNQVTLAVNVRDSSSLPAIEANAIWKMAESTCCRVHVVSGTAADRDLPELLPVIDAAVQQAADRLGERPQQQFDVYLIDRIIGQGGYAGSSMVVSYADRDYSSNDVGQVLVHEAVHLLDRQFAPQRVSFLAEGLAVWASDGHYKREDLHQAAAALVELEEFVTLDQLISQFYPTQHEIGYWQAAGLVSYLIDAYGWQRFRDFYVDTTQDDADTLVAAVDLNLQKHYRKTLDEMESDWLSFLRSLPLDRSVTLDVRTTLRYYEIMRRYQRRYDPTAHFLIAWLPAPAAVQEQGNPADLTRHPSSGLNVTLEVMLQAAGDSLLIGDYNRAAVLLNSVQRVLDRDGQFLDPLSTSYRRIVQSVMDSGYEVKTVTLNGDEAVVLASEIDSTVNLELRLKLEEREWVLTD